MSRLEDAVLSSDLQFVSDRVFAYYQERLAAHSDTALGAGWPCEEDRETRFKTVVDFVLSVRTGSPVVICDFGCGTGELLTYVRERRLSMVEYVGVDRSAEALAYARRKHPCDRFYELDVLAADNQARTVLNCDLLVANGVFTVKHTLSYEAMWTFTQTVIRTVWPYVRRGVIFNVMSTSVDWDRSDLFHVSYDKMAAFLHRLAGRHIGFRADYGLYEYMAYALKVSEAYVHAPRSHFEPFSTSLGGRKLRVCVPRLPATEAIADYMAIVEKNRWYSNHGPMAQRLEQRLSRAFGHNTSVVSSASSGTTALVGAILGTSGRAEKSRSICLCPAYTFVGTLHSILQCGYEVQLVDVDPHTWSIDVNSILNHPLIDRTGVVVVVAPYGRRIDIGPWEEFHIRTGIHVVVDAAAGIESLFTNPSDCVGGVPVVLSLHATKVFATGEGGAIVCTDPPRLTNCMQALNFGMLGLRSSTRNGTNGKMSEYHAAVGLAELDGWEAKRKTFKRVADSYNSHSAAYGLGNRIITSPQIASSYVLFQAADANEASRVQQELDRNNVEHRRWYGQGLHREPAFAAIASDPCPNTEHLADTLIGLPVAVDIPDAIIAKVLALVKAARHSHE